MKVVYKIGNQTFDRYEMDHILDLWGVYTISTNREIIDNVDDIEHVSWLKNHLNYHREIKNKFKNAIEIIEVPE